MKIYNQSETTKKEIYLDFEETTVMGKHHSFNMLVRDFSGDYYGRLFSIKDGMLVLSNKAQAMLESSGFNTEELYFDENGAIKVGCE